VLGAIPFTASLWQQFKLALGKFCWAWCLIGNNKKKVWCLVLSPLLSYHTCPHTPMTQQSYLALFHFYDNLSFSRSFSTSLSILISSLFLLQESRRVL